MSQEAETLGLAQSTLEAIGPPVYLSREEMPEALADEHFVLDLIASTGVAGYGTNATTKRVQVTAYARTRTRTLQMTAEARNALFGAGFRFIQQRPALDADVYGEISEYRR